MMSDLDGKILIDYQLVKFYQLRIFYRVRDELLLDQNSSWTFAYIE